MAGWRLGGRQAVAAAGLALLSGAPARASVAEGRFHSPLTAAELALDRILKQVDADPDPMGDLLGGRGGPGFRRTVEYDRMLTAPLIAAIARAEAAEVRKNCGGRYLDGELCGLDFLPMTCAQDWVASYLYRTDQARRDAAVITYEWPGTEYGRAKPVATYRFVRQKGRWKIDGIGCVGGTSFNMSAGW